MKKVLIAGPTILARGLDAGHFRIHIRNGLSRLLDHSNDGLVYALDTVTGRFVDEWAKARIAPAFPHTAFDKPLGGELLTGDARALIEARNEAMMAEEGIRRALLFMESNEVAPFITGLRQKAMDIDIIRIL